MRAHRKGAASAASDRALFDAAKSLDRLQRLANTYAGASDWESLDRLMPSLDQLRKFVAKTPAATLAGALLKLQRIPGWADPRSDLELPMLKDVVAVMKREIARSSSAGGAK